MPITRQATIADLDTIVPLFDGYRQFYKQSSDIVAARAFLLDKFQHSESTIFICEDGDQAIGFAQLFPTFSSAAMRRVYILNDLFVLPQARGRGVGRMLLQAAATFAKDIGAIRLQLVTAKDNMPAQTLYTAMGWQQDTQYYTFNLTV